MINNLFEEVKDISLKEYASNSNYEEYAGIILDPDNNTFKILSGLFRDKKEMYDKMRKRGLVCRKVFEKKIFYWVLDNAKSVLDAYLMLSTAFSKWRNNNILADYYIKLLNDLPKINREKRKGDPQSIGSNKGWYKESILQEDFDKDEEDFRDEIPVTIQPIIAITNDNIKNVDKSNRIIPFGKPISFVIKTAFLNYKNPNSRVRGKNTKRYDDPNFYTYIYNLLNHWNLINLMEEGQEKEFIIDLINKEYDNIEKGKSDELLYLKPGVLVTEINSDENEKINTGYPNDEMRKLYPDIKNNQFIILDKNIFTIMNTKVWKNDYDWVWNEINPNNESTPLYKPEIYADLIDIKSDLVYYSTLKNTSTDKNINAENRNFINEKIKELKNKKQIIINNSKNRMTGNSEYLYIKTVKALRDRRNELIRELDSIEEKQKTNKSGMISSKKDEKIKKLKVKINFFNQTIDRLSKNKKNIQDNFAKINNENVKRINNNWANNLLSRLLRPTNGTEEQQVNKVDKNKGVEEKLLDFYNTVKNGNIKKDTISMNIINQIEKYFNILPEDSIIYKGNIVQNTEEDKPIRELRAKNQEIINKRNSEVADKTIKDWKNSQVYNPDRRIQDYMKIFNDTMKDVNTNENNIKKETFYRALEEVIKNKAKEFEKLWVNKDRRNKFLFDYKSLFDNDKYLNKARNGHLYDNDFEYLAKQYFDNISSDDINITNPYENNKIIKSITIEDRENEFKNSLLQNYKKFLPETIEKYQKELNNFYDILKRNQEKEIKLSKDDKEELNKKIEVLQKELQLDESKLKENVNYDASLLYNTQPKTNNLHGEIVEEVTNDQLNQKLFDGNKLREDVRIALLKIALVFEKILEMPINCEDVYFTGSCANYNYNEHSDIDLHLVYDFSKLEQYKEILDNYFNNTKKLFNNKYHITVKDYPIEVGIEDINKPLISSGVYSLVNNKWIKEPNNANIEIQEPDKGFYNLLINDIEKAIQSKDSNIIGDLWKKLGNLRKVSLANLGEFGPGNTLFKRLRNEKYLERLKDAYYNSKSDELSVESLEEII